MNVSFLKSLPYPYSVFDSLSEVTSFFRLHGSYQYAGGVKHYTYSLFKLIPIGGIYSQMTVNNINAGKLLEVFGLSADFVKPYDQYEGMGSIYFQMNHQVEPQLLEAISKYPPLRYKKAKNSFAFKPARAEALI